MKRTYGRELAKAFVKWADAEDGAKAARHEFLKQIHPADRTPQNMLMVWNTYVSPVVLEIMKRRVKSPKWPKVTSKSLRACMSQQERRFRECAHQSKSLEATRDYRKNRRGADKSDSEVTLSLTMEPDRVTTTVAHFCSRYKMTAGPAECRGAILEALRIAGLE